MGLARWIAPLSCVRDAPLLPPITPYLGLTTARSTSFCSVHRSGLCLYPHHRYSGLPPQFLLASLIFHLAVGLVILPIPSCDSPQQDRSRSRHVSRLLFLVQRLDLQLPGVSGRSFPVRWPLLSRLLRHPHQRVAKRGLTSNNLRSLFPYTIVFLATFCRADEPLRHLKRPCLSNITTSLGLDLCTAEDLWLWLYSSIYSSVLELDVAPSSRPEQHAEFHF